MVLGVILAQPLAAALGDKSLLKLAAVAIISLVLWSSLVKPSKKLFPALRKFFLSVFSILFIVPYMKAAAVITQFLTEEFRLNYVVSNSMQEFKGTDWLDGILSATFFFIYVGLVIRLWNLEKKASKPPDAEKPFKIEARIGNVKE